VRLFPIRFLFLAMRRVQTPPGLRPPTRRWFRDVIARWQLEQHHERLLALAARAYDEAEAAESAYRHEGMVVRQPSGRLAPHPGIAIAAEARRTYARMIRELDLDVDPPAQAARPPALRSIAGGRR
jgi:phage terminase small subunit